MSVVDVAVARVLAGIGRGVLVVASVSKPR